MRNHLLLIAGLALFGLLAIRIRNTLDARRIAGPVVVSDDHGDAGNGAETTVRPSRKRPAWTQHLTPVNVVLGIAAFASVIASQVLD